MTPQRQKRAHPTPPARMPERNYPLKTSGAPRRQGWVTVARASQATVPLRATLTSSPPVANPQLLQLEIKMLAVRRPMWPPKSRRNCRIVG